MILIPPKGPVSIAKYLVRRMTALSPTFREFARVDTQARALERIHFREVDSKLPRPCAVITTDSNAFSKMAGGGQVTMVPNGTVFLWLGMDIPDEYTNDLDAATALMDNFHGCVGNEIADLSEQDQTEDQVYPDSHLAITAMHDIAPNVVPEEFWHSFGKFMWSAWMIEWGDR